MLCYFLQNFSKNKNRLITVKTVVKLKNKFYLCFATQQQYSIKHTYMEKLTKAEERIMQALWKLERAALGDIRNALPKGEKIPPTTVASMIKVLVKKGYVEYETFGRTNVYTPTFSKSDYRKFLMNNMVSNYFDGSFKKMVSFFAKEEKLDKADIEDLLKELEDGN